MSQRFKMSAKQNQQLVLGLAAAAGAALVMYVMTRDPKAKATERGGGGGKSLDDDDGNYNNKSRSISSTSTSGTTTSATIDAATMARAKQKNDELNNASDGGASTNQPKMDEKTLHAKIEDMDKKGKALFKSKNFLEAAKAFTEALAFIEQNTDHSDISNSSSTSSSLNKQIVTLINNRSAMYEKGSFPELAVDDCNKILEVYDRFHVKARQRKLRILETNFKNYYDALVEVCSLQLLYMQQNRDQLRMGLPASSPPPVPQSKLEELITKLIPEQMEQYDTDKQQSQKGSEEKPLPSDYTLLQLLKSFTGYNSWMSQAAKDGPTNAMETKLVALPEAALADRASIMLRQGRRYVFDGKYSMARQTFLKAYDLVKDKPEVYNIMEGDDYPRLLEWTGMVKHWTYDLDGASTCYEACAKLEPINAEVLVKQAGVAMDGGKHEKALELFDRALKMDPNVVDALLHRANLRMLQQDLKKAQEDLERCVQLRPNHVQAHLRLAAVLTSQNDAAGASRHLEQAEQVDPESSEVQSYRGELLFTQNAFADAKAQFEKAIELEPSNPTPYVNAALAELNTPPTSANQQMEMAKEACRLLEKAIEVDPQFHAAYVQLGQLRLGTATDLESARSVISLYDQGLENCRTKEELKDLVSMKLLTQAQVDAATSLKMETFSMQ